MRKFSPMIYSGGDSGIGLISRRSASLLIDLHVSVAGTEDSSFAMRGEVLE
jgi:hypothetical protein